MTCESSEWLIIKADKPEDELFANDFINKRHLDVILSKYNFNLIYNKWVEMFKNMFLEHSRVWFQRPDQGCTNQDSIWTRMLIFEIVKVSPIFRICHQYLLYLCYQFCRQPSTIFLLICLLIITWENFYVTN